MSHPNWLVRFVTESNRIEGIRRNPYTTELDVTELFLAMASPTLQDIEAAALIFTRGEGRLRRHAGMDVQIGAHVPMAGGPELVEQLEQFVQRVCVEGRGVVEYNHRVFEILHPFMDGNGRTGRLLWAWQMERERSAQWRRLGFLHTWYYQSLAAEQ